MGRLEGNEEHLKGFLVDAQKGKKKANKKSFWKK
jgi:hypothetical protein